MITSYFLQQSAVFLAAEAMPQLFSIVNFSIVGEHSSAGRTAGTAMGFTSYCIAPLSDTGRIGLTLFSPVIAFGLLGVIALLDCAARSYLRLRRIRPSTMVYSWLSVLTQPTLSTVAEPQSPCASSSAPASESMLTTALLPIPAGPDKERKSASASRALFSVEPSQVVSSSSAFNWAAYQRSCIRLLQLSYTGLTVVCLSVFHVVQVGEFGWRLVDYPSLSPDSAAYHQLLPVIVLVLSLVVCGIPLAQSVFLFHQHRHGHIHFVKAYQRQHPDETGRGHQAGLGRKNALLLQLTAAYKRPYFWMSVVVHLRRLVLVALLDTVREGSVWAFVTLVNYCLLALHLHLKPYERAHDNVLESLTLLSLCLQTSVMNPS
jgi:hypothetical protein